MKKIIALALAVLMILTCLAGCGKSGNDNLANAVSYLENMYQTGKKDEPMKIESDKDVLSVVTVDGVTYNVEWTITVTDGASDAVKIAESETTNCVKIDVPELPEADILFTATATVKDDKDNTSAATFSYKIFGLNIDNGDGTTSDDDTTSDDGTTSDDSNTPSGGGNTSSDSGNTSSDSGNKQLPVVTDQAKILKDAFALGKNKTTPYIAVLTGKVISIDKDYSEQYGSVTVTITVGDKNIKCYNMKVGSVSGGSKVKPGDTITVKGVIKNFYYDEADTSGTVEFTWDDASQTEVVLTKLVAGQAEAKLSIVDSPVAGTKYKFGTVQENKNNDLLYLTGAMQNKYYFGTTTAASAAIDVYLEETTGGYYLATTINGAKKYINMVVSGTHENAVYQDAAATVYTYDATLKTLVTTLNTSDGAAKFAFASYGTYTTVCPCNIEDDKADFYCHFYK